MDIVAIFERILKGAEMILNTAVDKIEKKGLKFFVHLDSGCVLEVDKIIITTGGQGAEGMISRGSWGISLPFWLPV